MRVFITGGTGFIGAAVVKELIENGHEVVGLARSEESKRVLTDAGASAFDGSLEDADSLKRGAETAAAVVHLAFVHNFDDFVASVETDRRAIEAIGETLVGTGKPFIVTSGVPSSADGRVVTENDESDPRFPRLSEQAALPFAERGVRVSIVRPSRFVHGDGDVHGFVPQLIGIAREKGVSIYIGNGANRLHAVHRLDLARLFRLALENGKTGARYQAVGDSAVQYRDIAEVIGKRLHVPTDSISAEQATGHFDFLGGIVSADNPASSGVTKAALGWQPTHPPLLEDLATGYDEVFNATM
ncbi:MAG: SDR family oxidoreductase [Synergistaceae bacterium]|jgi:nucleoside-diphosphate-sugar epimerase|nr:SDR family oxidoreductase [Synergistaceae bacterium]